MKNDIMYEDILDFKEMIEKNKIEGHNDDYYIWTVCCVHYFYYNGNLSKNDLKNQWTDGGGDGEIDFVYNDKENNLLYLIQGKSEQKLNFNDIKTEFQKMSDTIIIFEKKQEEKYGLNPRLKKAYKKGMENKKSNNIVLVLFTNTIITDKIREKLDSWKKEFKYKILIYGKEEIEDRKVMVSTGEKSVKNGFLCCSEDNVLHYSNGINEGVIVNVKASSLKDLFDKEINSELFGYNLREHISDNKLGVDRGIETTIREEMGNFWFYNNGITIGCSDFSIKQNKLTLKNFSIINGAQTTFTIGKSTEIDENNDFYVVCKVVKAPKSLDDVFIKEISKNSNSQKTIEPRDLYANAKEQVWLQYKFRKNTFPLSVSIKRGVKPSNYYDVKDWERIENSDLGQIILAAYLQRPGTARNSPNQIFSNKEIYHSIFDLDIVKNYNYNALYDLVRLNYLCDKYKKSLINSKEKQMETLKRIDKINKVKTEIGIIKNSGYTIISAITYLIKRLYFNLPNIKNNGDDEWNRFIQKRIDNDLSLHYSQKDYKSKIYRLFYLILDILTIAYNDEVKRPLSRIDNPSNYFKRDDLYRSQIVEILDDLVDNKRNSEIIQLLEIFNDVKNRES